jgi:hypothetical protein
MSSKALETYIYEPLKTLRSIRVIELLPGERDAPLACRLTEHDSAVDVEYEALSYVWGKPVFSERIDEVSTRTVICITENLSYALQALRYPDRSRCLWVDAICINQAENEEKGHQVQHMGQIYERARMVVVWLGRESGQEAFKLLQTLAELIISEPQEEPEREHLESLFNECFDSLALSTLLASEWFQRVWVVQELVLAKEVELHAGYHNISYHLFECATRGLWKQHWQTTSQKTNPSRRRATMTFMNRLSLVDDLVYHRKRHRMQRLSVSLYDSCGRFADETRKCSDKRDRIYAFLGLASEETRIPSDYNLTLDQIRLEMSWASLGAGEFGILHSAVGCDKEDSIPSFVGCMSKLEFLSRELTVSLEGRGFGAGSSRAPHARALRPRSLRIRGVSVDRVDEVVQVDIKVSETPYGTLDKAWWTNLREIYGVIESSYAKKPASWPYGRNDIKQLFLRTVKFSLRVETGGVSTSRFFDDEWNDEVDEKMLDEVFCKQDPGLLWLARWYRTRCFFMTEKGYLGRGLKSTKKGDKVVIFDGGKTPFLLREAGHHGDVKKYKLVGDCYVEGWMDGKYFGHKIVDEVDGKCGGPLTRRKAKTRSSRKKLCSEDFIIC